MADIKADVTAPRQGGDYGLATWAVWKRASKVSEPESWPSDSSFECLANGVVDQAMFDAFAEAHSYGAASSMNFLNARLAALLLVLRRGVTLHLYDPRGAVSASSERDYRAWANKHFSHAKF